MTYIAKCYLREQGTDAVLDLAEASQGRSSLVLAVTEVEAAFYRDMREGRLSQSVFVKICRRFDIDQKEGFWHWLPLDDDFVRRAARRFRAFPSHLFLRWRTACIYARPSKVASSSSTRVTATCSRRRRILACWE